MAQRSISSLSFWGRSVSVFLAATLLAVVPAAGQQDTGQIDRIVRAEPIQVPEDLTIRARLKVITPSEPSVIRWRYGGEGPDGGTATIVVPAYRRLLDGSRRLCPPQVESCPFQ